MIGLAPFGASWPGRDLLLELFVPDEPSTGHTGDGGRDPDAAPSPERLTKVETRPGQ